MDNGYRLKANTLRMLYSGESREGSDEETEDEGNIEIRIAPSDENNGQYNHNRLGIIDYCALPTRRRRVGNASLEPRL